MARITRIQKIYQALLFYDDWTALSQISQYTGISENEISRLAKPPIEKGWVEENWRKTDVRARKKYLRISDVPEIKTQVQKLVDSLSNESEQNHSLSTRKKKTSNKTKPPANEELPSDDEEENLVDSLSDDDLDLGTDSLSVDQQPVEKSPWNDPQKNLEIHLEDLLVSSDEVWKKLIPKGGALKNWLTNNKPRSPYCRRQSALDLITNLVNEVISMKLKEFKNGDKTA